MYQLGFDFQAGDFTGDVNESLENKTCDTAMKSVLAGGNIRGKVSCKGCRVNVEVAIAGFLDPLAGRRQGLLDGGRAFPGVRRESGNIDKGSDFWIVASFGDDSTTVRVSHENHWPGLTVDHGLRELDVFGKRGLWVLYHRHRVPVLL